jgi:hypothetical protein
LPLAAIRTVHVVPAQTEGIPPRGVFRFAIEAYTDTNRLPVPTSGQPPPWVITEKTSAGRTALHRIAAHSQPRQCGNGLAPTAAQQYVPAGVLTRDLSPRHGGHMRPSASLDPP